MVPPWNGRVTAKLPVLVSSIFGCPIVQKERLFTSSFEKIIVNHFAGVSAGNGFSLYFSQAIPAVKDKAARIVPRIMFFKDWSPFRLPFTTHPGFAWPGWLL